MSVDVFKLISEVDLVTPLCSQVTYQGLLDDIFGINCGFVEFGPEITQKSDGVKLILSSKDEVRRQLTFIGLTLNSTDTHFDASTNIRQLLKTLWEKEKLLVTSNFSFSHNVFY